MTGLIVSVRSVPEALLATSAGVDLVDIKDPIRGALGAADVELACRICREIGKHATLSVALGELAEDATTKLAAWSALWLTLPTAERPKFMKIGLAGCGGNSNLLFREQRAINLADSESAFSPAGLAQWREIFTRLPPEVAGVAVAYADWQAARAPHPLAILELAIPIGAHAILLDTFAKNGPGLTQLWSAEQCAAWVRAAKARALCVVLAGKLRCEDVENLADLGADYLAVRSAACVGGRQGALDASRLEMLRDRLRDRIPRRSADWPNGCVRAAHYG